MSTETPTIGWIEVEHELARPEALAEPIENREAFEDLTDRCMFFDEKRGAIIAAQFAAIAVVPVKVHGQARSCGLPLDIGVPDSLRIGGAWVTHPELAPEVPANSLAAVNHTLKKLENAEYQVRVNVDLHLLRRVAEALGEHEITLCLPAKGGAICVLPSNESNRGMGFLMPMRKRGEASEGA